MILPKIELRQTKNKAEHVNPANQRKTTKKVEPVKAADQILSHQK